MNSDNIASDSALIFNQGAITKSDDSWKKYRWITLLLSILGGIGPYHFAFPIFQNRNCSIIMPICMMAQIRDVNIVETLNEI